MKPIPIVFFAFANEEGRYLDALKAESSAIYAILQPLEQDGRLLVVREESADSGELFATFRRFKDRMLIFHFAGHAGSNLLALEDLEADGDALAQLFKEQKDTLKLVFLNGCATNGQVAGLLQHGIRAVVATNRPIEDRSAQFFAETFYAALAEGQYSLKEAFAHARTALATKFQKAANEFRGIDLSSRQDAGDFAWGLYGYREEDLDWKIGDPFLPMSELRKASIDQYNELREGAFRYLRVEDALLKGQKIKEKPGIIPIIVSYEGENFQLETAVQKLWSQTSPHAILTGKGGMGKTVSLDYLWRHFLDHSNPDRGIASEPIPLYLALEEVNEWGHDFNNHHIRQLLRKNYYIEDLKDFLGEHLNDSPPNVLLLLDGIHYVSAEKMHQLVEEITLLCNTKSFPNLQLIITAQEDIRPNYSGDNWAELLHLFELQPLSHLDIRKYLGESVPLNAELVSLLSNPMMLSLYKVSTAAFEKQTKGPFKTDVTKVGELLCNVEWMTLCNLQEKQEGKPEAERALQRFVLEHLLPSVAWTMHQADITFISRKENPDINLRSLLARAIPELLTEQFFDTFDRYYDRHLDERHLDQPPRHLFNKVIREICLEKLAMMVEEKEGARFLHNLFREYFAARHVLNQMDLALNSGILPPILRTMQLKPNICRMIGEIEGEHLLGFSGQSLHPAWAIAPAKPNRIARLLELCRGNFREQHLGFTLQNLIRMMVLSRGELSGADLHLLDLRKVELNGIRLSRPGIPGARANFFGAMVSKKTFFGSNAIFRRKFTRLSPDSQRILFASKKGEISEWTLSSPNTCIRAFDCGVQPGDIQYTADGTCLLLFTETEILEWNLHRLCTVNRYSRETLPAGKTAAEKLPDEAIVKRIARMRNMTGMYFQGCDFGNLHPESPLDADMVHLIRQYGGIFTPEDARHIETALPPQGVP